MADWDIRPAAATDVEAVAELRAVVMRADLERLGRYDEHRVRQRLRDAFAPEHTWVIDVGGAVAGCVALRPAGDAHWLEHFYLDPRLQGGGIGTAVLRELLERCDRDGVPVRLNVLRAARPGGCTSGTGSPSTPRIRSTCSWCASPPPCAAVDPRVSPERSGQPRGRSTRRPTRGGLAVPFSFLA